MQEKSQQYAVFWVVSKPSSILSQQDRFNLSDKHMANYHVRCKSSCPTCRFAPLQNQSSSETTQMK